MKKIIILIIASLVMANAWAEDGTANPATGYYSSGYYLGMNLGTAYAAFPSVANYQRKMGGATARLYIGYNISHYFALDVGYLWLPTVRYKATVANQHGIKISNSGFDLNLKAKYPIGEGFSLYGQGGMAILRLYQKSDQPIVTQNATTFTYGGGLDYVFANIGGLHTTLDYERVGEKSGQDIRLPNYNLYSLGVYYQF